MLNINTPVSSIILAALFFMLAASSNMHAQDDASTTEEEVQEVRRKLVDRLSPAEAAMLERIDAIEDNQRKDDPWLQPPVIVAAILAAAGWLVALYQSTGNRRQRTWEQLLESLKWFEGGAQRRSIGIAVVESKWKHHKEFRDRWASILVNQAIYLLTRQKYRDAIHEQANLYRIMNLLITTVKFKPGGHMAEIERQLLYETLLQYDPDSDRGLKNLDTKKLKSWQEYFCQNTEKSA